MKFHYHQTEMCNIHQQLSTFIWGLLSYRTTREEILNNLFYFRPAEQFLVFTNCAQKQFQFPSCVSLSAFFQLCRCPFSISADVHSQSLLSVYNCRHNVQRWLAEVSVIQLMFSCLFYHKAIVLVKLNPWNSF